MKKLFALLIPGLALLMSLFGCAASHPSTLPTRVCPSWTRSGSLPTYPPDTYLVGLGVVGNVWEAARGEEAGRAAALADIAKQLRVKVSGETNLREWTGSESGAGTEISDQSSLHTDVTLAGATVVERCFEPSEATFYALAVLSRAELASQVQKDFSAALDRARTAHSAMKKAEAQGRLIDAARHVREAYAQTLEAEQLAAVIRSLDAESPKAPEPSSWDLQAHQRKLDALNLVRIRSGDRFGPVEDAIRQAVAGVGVQLEDGDNPPPTGSKVALLLRVDVQERHVGRSRAVRRAWIADLTAKVELIRMDTRAVVDSFSRSERGGGASANQARQAASRSLAQSIAKEIPSMVLQALGREPEPSSRNGQISRGISREP